VLILAVLIHGKKVGSARYKEFEQGRPSTYGREFLLLLDLPGLI
jgi:hypothetical protein